MPLESLAVTAKQLAAVLIKVWALTLIVSAILGLQAVLAQYFAPEARADASWRIVAGWNFVNVLVGVIAGTVLLLYASRIAAKLTGDLTSVQGSTGNVATIEAVAFACVGLYFAVRGIREIVVVLFELATKPQYETDSLSYLWRTVPETLVGAIGQTVCGLILFFGRNGIATGWRAVRSSRELESRSEDIGG